MTLILLHSSPSVPFRMDVGLYPQVELLLSPTITAIAITVDCRASQTRVRLSSTGSALTTLTLVIPETDPGAIQQALSQQLGVDVYSLAPIVSFNAKPGANIPLHTSIMYACL
jgi:hypothetical protein